VGLFEELNVFNREVLKLCFQSGDFFQSHSEILFADDVFLFHHPGLLFQSTIDKLQLLERVRLIEHLNVDWRLPEYIPGPSELPFLNLPF
jgi:hypothetical protein